jgi:hypothetical protein
LTSVSNLGSVEISTYKRRFISGLCLKIFNNVAFPLSHSKFCRFTKVLIEMFEHISVFARENILLIEHLFHVQNKSNSSYCLTYNGCTALCWTLAAFSLSQSFTQSVGLLGQGISPSQGRYLHTGHNKRTQISMLQEVFERAKTVHALDRAATVIGTD